MIIDKLKILRLMLKNHGVDYVNDEDSLVYELNMAGNFINRIRNFEFEFEPGIINTRQYITDVEDEYHSYIQLELASASILKWGILGEKVDVDGGKQRTYDTSSNYPIGIVDKITPKVKVYKYVEAESEIHPIW